MPAERARGQQNPRGEGHRLREQLLDAADRVLVAHGDDGALSLRAVAREAGVSAQAVYRHFAGLDDLLLAVQDRRFGELGALLAAANEKADPRLALHAVARAYCGWGLQHPQVYRALFGALRTPVAAPSASQLPGAEVFAQLQATVAAALRDEERALRATLNLWLTLHGIVSLRLALPVFAWPPVDALVDDALAGALGLGLAS